MSLNLSSPFSRSTEERGYVRHDVLRGVLDAQFWLIGLTPFLAAVTTVRYFDEGYATAVSTQYASGPARFASLATSRGALLLAFLGLIAVLPRLRFDQRGKALTTGFAAFVGSSVLAAVLGSQPASMMAPLTLLVVGVTWYLAPAVGMSWLLRRLRLLLGFYVVGSLIAALFLPHLALETGYDASRIPGVQFRLHGIAPHANVLAPLVLLGLVVERLSPRGTLWGGALRTTGWLALLLTQSKTTLLAAIAIMMVEWYRGTRDRERSARLFADSLAMLGLIVLAAFVWHGGSVDEVAGGQAGLHTFHARQDVWNVTLGLWRENPVFGYGLDLWGAGMRIDYFPRLGWVAPHAHNQVVQTLGQAGLVGALALGYYVAQLVKLGLRHASATNGLALATVVLVLVRSTTETPLDAVATLLPGFLTFIVILSAARSRSETEWCKPTDETASAESVVCLSIAR